jgi:hypothetical protein
LQGRNKDVGLDRRRNVPFLAGKIFSRFSMRFLISSLIVLLLAVGAASAQEATPTPTASAPQSTGTPQETQSASPAPTVSPTPELHQQEPELLPESKTLPSPPAETPLPEDLIPQGIKPQFPGSIPNPTSSEQLEKDRIRFRQIRTIAVLNPYAIYFWRRARLAHTDEMKREYLRVYYTTMCDQMRKLEPRLRPMIDAFEAANIGRASQTALRPTIPARDIPRFKAAEKGQ